MILRILGVLTVHSVKFIVCTKILFCADRFYVMWLKVCKDNVMEEKMNFIFRIYVKPM